MGSDLRHKLPEDLRKEIEYQSGKIALCSNEIDRIEGALTAAKNEIDALQGELWRLKMKRNNHHQRLVWSKNYLTMRGEEV